MCSHLFLEQLTWVNIGINLTGSELIRSKPYPIPHSKLESVKHEIDFTLNIGVIELSDSPFCSPIIIVKKSKKM